MTNYNFKNLVFEGGGVKGIAYGGALEELEKRNILNGITRVAGTSAGAINACLLALGYSYKEVSDIIAQTSFKSFVCCGHKREIVFFWYFQTIQVPFQRSATK